MIPMLAHRYAEKKKHVTYPCYIQPKIDGVRGVYNNSIFQTRDEKVWNAPVVEHLESELTGISNHILLDGELYVHGWPLQKINAAISVNRLHPTKNSPHVQFHVFDCIDVKNLSMPFSERFNLLQEILPANSLKIFSVPTYKVHTEIEADQYYSHFLSLNYEGMMYRLNRPYGLLDDCGNKENRWPYLLKRKDWLDENCECVDVIPGEEGTKYENVVGSLKLRFPNGIIFSAGSGLSDIQRHQYMDIPPIGDLVRIKYKCLTEAGRPREPIIAAVLD